MNKSIQYISGLGITCLIFLVSCTEQEKATELAEKAVPTLFTLMPPDSTGVDFVNTVENQKNFNIFKYRNFYNGGGVAIGDINDDGLPDLFLTGNMVPNRLYLNKGNFEFEDISERAGVL
ncbi:MAG: VCBS repeat-containing protein, partial [Robiginitalea sp.]|uniref:FG-GAP repeat domain-containing protein n=1 Tax=Robiginitalea sp. TaxID=1902411 RepID=UPI003C758FE2